MRRSAMHAARLQEFDSGALRERSQRDRQHGGCVELLEIAEPYARRDDDKPRIVGRQLAQQHEHALIFERARDTRAVVLAAVVATRRVLQRLHAVEEEQCPLLAYEADECSALFGGRR